MFLAARALSDGLPILELPGATVFVSVNSLHGEIVRTVLLAEAGLDNGNFIPGTRFTKFLLILLVSPCCGAASAFHYAQNKTTSCYLARVCLRESVAGECWSLRAGLS